MTGIGATSGSIPGGGGLGAGSIGGASAPSSLPTEEQGKSFGDALKEMVIEKPSQSHHEADTLAAQFAAGANIDPHSLAIATAKASVEIQMASRVITQAVSGVRTLMQMQI